MIYLKAKNEKDLSFTFIGIGNNEAEAIGGLLLSILRQLHTSPEIRAGQDTMRHALAMIRAAYPVIPPCFCYEDWHFFYGQIKN